jgi:hypothetical protein
VTERLLNLFEHTETKRRLLLGALWLALTAMLMTGLVAIGIGNVVAFCFALIGVGAKWHACSEIRAERTDKSIWLRRSWLGFYVIICAAIILPTTIGAWQLIGGAQAARRAQSAQNQTTQNPAFEYVKSAASEAVAHADSLSRKADELIDIETANGGVCQMTPGAIGATAELLREASGRYGTLAQMTRRYATNVRTLGERSVNGLRQSTERAAQINEIANQILRDAQSLDDESARFRNGTPFVSVIENSSYKCTNQDLAVELSLTAKSLHSFYNTLSDYADTMKAPSDVVSNDRSTPSFGNRLSIYEIASLVMALLTEFGIILVAYSRQSDKLIVHVRDQVVLLDLEDKNAPELLVEAPNEQSATPEHGDDKIS